MDFDNTSNNNYPHGLATMSILAGGQAKVIKRDGSKECQVYDGYIGAAPMVEVICVRVCPEVALFRQSPLVKHRLTHILDWAIENEVDAISMSMGGLPSTSMETAVKRARRNGVAMFFAAGNYMTFPGISFLRTPDTVVFPAAMSGVMGVAGATATDRTYGHPPQYFSFFDHGLKNWCMRGNWGPRWQMQNVMAGYTPNIAWVKPDECNSPNFDLIDCDGGGTSCATPQVAGAAALWLQYHRNAFTESQWRSCVKVDAVYRALADSAKSLPPAPKSEDYTERYFGHGVVQADAALDITPAEAMRRNATDSIYQERSEYQKAHFIARIFGFFASERTFYTKKDLEPYEIR